MPEETLPPATRRFDTIDLLRGLSVIAVILLHTYLRFYFSVEPAKPPFARSPLMHLFLLNGGNGVTVFFAISGFLIAYTSIKRFSGLERLRASTFYRIRFARIAPLLLIVLAVLSVLHLAHVTGFVISAKKGQSLPMALLSAVTFWLNKYEAWNGYLPANWDVLWTLSIEETFYVLFPLACVVLLRFKRVGWAVFLAVAMGLIAAGPFARVVWPVDDVAAEKAYLGGTDAIALGVLTALLVAWLQRRPALSPRLLLGLQALGGLIIALIAYWPRWAWIRPSLKFLGKTGLDSTLLPLGVCLVMLASVLRGRPGCRWTAPLRWVGRHSYEMYITHEFVVIGVFALYVRLKPNHALGLLQLWFAAVVLLVMPLGWAVARWVSEPLNRRLRGANPPRIEKAERP